MKGILFSLFLIIIVLVLFKPSLKDESNLTFSDPLNLELEKGNFFKDLLLDKENSRFFQGQNSENMYFVIPNYQTDLDNRVHGVVVVNKELSTIVLHDFVINGIFVNPT